MNRLATVALLVVMTLAGCQGPVGRPPAGYTLALTGGGPPPAWVVRADPTAPGGGGTAIVQESTDQTSYRFPLLIADQPVARDVTASTSFKAIAGEVDQAAGLVLRYTPENYYVARANALEDNVNLFKTVNGNRIKLDEVDAKVAANVWHTLTFTAKGSHLTVALDGKVVVERDDTTFANAGRVGLWTKADSVTAFADPHARVDP